MAKRRGNRRSQRPAKRGFNKHIIPFLVFPLLLLSVLTLGGTQLYNYFTNPSTAVLGESVTKPVEVTAHPGDYVNPSKVCADAKARCEPGKKCVVTTPRPLPGRMTFQQAVDADWCDDVKTLPVKGASVNTNPTDLKLGPFHLYACSFCSLTTTETTTWCDIDDCDDSTCGSVSFRNGEYRKWMHCTKTLYNPGGGAKNSTNCATPAKSASWQLCPDGTRPETDPGTRGGPKPVKEATNKKIRTRVFIDSRPDGMMNGGEICSPVAVKITAGNQTKTYKDDPSIKDCEFSVNSEFLVKTQNTKVTAANPKGYKVIGGAVKETTKTNGENSVYKPFTGSSVTVKGDATIQFGLQKIESAQ